MKNFFLRVVIVFVACAGAAEGVLADVFVPGVSSELNTLITRCAPTVHPETMAALVSAESRGHLYAIADAGPVRMPWAQRKFLVKSFYEGNLDDAVSRANELIANGHTVSLGLSQVNDRNLARLGLTVRSVFDPCTNLAAGGRIITDFYVKAVKQFGPGQRALRAAISGYNSGDWVRGERDGYVNLVFKQRGRSLKLQTAAVASRRMRVSGMKRDVRQQDVSGDTKRFAMSVSKFMVSGN